MQVKAFRAFRFDRAVVGDPGGCAAPPYDVIDAQQQRLLYDKSPYNIARITKGLPEPGDDQSSNCYSRAAGFLETWIRTGALKPEESDAVYGYVQDFHTAGAVLRRLSFIALGRLEEFGPTVRPHEKTLNTPIADRLKLEQATGARFGLVFMLYDDPAYVVDGIMEKTAAAVPEVDFTDQNVRNRLYVIRDPEDVAAVVDMMREKSCIIADGHHRYTTALTYYRQTGNPAAAWQMIAFANTRHEALVVLATHRMVMGLPDFELDSLYRRLRDKFRVETFRFDTAASKEAALARMLEGMKAAGRAGAHAFGIYGGGGKFILAVLGKGPAASAKLDVSVLHEMILEDILGIDEKALAEQSNIEYVKDTDGAVSESIAAVDAGRIQVVFFMNPVTIEQLKSITDAGGIMPQKSTYFYPKLYSGLTVYKM